MTQNITTPKRRIGLHTMVYMDFKDHVPFYYVRLMPVETRQFPHGIALGATFTEKAPAEKFADDVDAYVEAFLSNRSPYAWEIKQGPRTFFVSADEFTRSSYDYGSFKPLYE